VVGASETTQFCERLPLFAPLLSSLTRYVEGRSSHTRGEIHKLPKLRSMTQGCFKNALMHSICLGGDVFGAFKRKGGFERECGFGSPLSNITCFKHN
jgi:hypothetical protein